MSFNQFAQELPSAPIASENFIVVSGLDDLPAPASGVITLEANKIYFLTDVVDLGVNRLECTGTCRISSEARAGGFTTSVDAALLTVTGSVFIESCSFSNTSTGLNSEVFIVDGGGVAGSIFLCIDNTITEAGNACGQFTDLDTVFITRQAIINAAQGYTFTNTGINQFGSIVLERMALRNIGASFTGFTFDANCSILHRINADNCKFDVASGQTVFSVNAATTIPAEGFELNSCLFSGSGTYVSGLTQADNATFFINNQNLADTGARGTLRNDGTGTSATTVGTAGTFVKATSTTTLINEERFDDDSSTNNRLRYIGATTINVNIQSNISFEGQNGQEYEFGIAKNDTVNDDSTMTGVGAGTGNPSFISLILNVTLSTNDYIELFGTNNDGTNSFTVTRLQLVANKT